MTDKDPDSRIESLPEEKREEYDERVEGIREGLEDDLLKKHRGDIKNQIDEDESELSDFNIVVSSFLDREKTSYQFIRTEPLIHTLEKNFDILVASPEKSIAVLVEIERTLLDRLPSKLAKFEGKMDVVKSNGSPIDVDEYFEKVIQTKAEQFDFVLGSTHYDMSDLEEKVANRTWDESEEDEDGEKELNFIAWMMASQGSKCRINDYTIKDGKTNSFDGHVDDQLERYIETALKKGVEKQDYVRFTHSSSKYLKMKHMSLALVNRYQRHDEEPTWDYQDWKQLFEADVDLYNYLEDEKETMFENFVEYGLECGIVGKEKDNGDLFEDKFKIKTNVTRDQEKLIDQLKGKMASHRMEDEFEKQLNEEKNRVATELEKDHATGGTTLDDFIDN